MCVLLGVQVFEETVTKYGDRPCLHYKRPKQVGHCPLPRFPSLHMFAPTSMFLDPHPPSHRHASPWETCCGIQAPAAPIWPVRCPFFLCVSRLLSLCLWLLVLSWGGCVCLWDP